MNRFIIGMLLAILITGVAEATEWTKTDYILSHCQGKSEVLLKGGTKVDCLTDTHAIKYSFMSEWADGIGKALYYAALTGKKPGIVFIINPSMEGTRYGAKALAAMNMVKCLKIDVHIMSTGF